VLFGSGAENRLRSTSDVNVAVVRLAASREGRLRPDSKTMIGVMAALLSSSGRVEPAYPPQRLLPAAQRSDND